MVLLFKRCVKIRAENPSISNWICTWKISGRELETVMKGTAGEIISEDGGQASVRTSNLKVINETVRNS